MKPLFPSSYECHTGGHECSSLTSFCVSFASSIVTQVTGTIWPNNSNPAHPPPQLQRRQQLRPLRPSPRHVLPRRMSFPLEMSADEKATAPQLEPAFEALLRSGTFTKKSYGHAESKTFLDREVFVALHHTVEGFSQAFSAGLGIDPAMGFSHTREMAKMVKAWNSAKIQADIKTKVGAVAKAHGEPVSMLKCD